jgi:hypothetical protein
MNGDRLLPSPHGDALGRACRRSVGRQPRRGVLGEEHHAGGRFCRQPRRHVHGVADGGELGDLVGDAHDADERRPGVDADTERHAVGGGAQQLHGRVHRPLGVVPAGERRHEQRHDLVSDQPVDECAVTDEDRHDRLVEAVQLLGELRGRHVLRTARRTSEVSEQDGDLDLGATDGNVRMAAPAQVRSEGRRPVPDRAQRMGQRPPERREAGLAERHDTRPPDDGLSHPSVDRAAGLGEVRAPVFLRASEAAGPPSVVPVEGLDDHERRHRSRDQRTSTDDDRLPHRASTRACETGSGAPTVGCRRGRVNALTADTRVRVMPHQAEGCRPGGVTQPTVDTLQSIGFR